MSIASLAPAPGKHSGGLVKDVVGFLDAAARSWRIITLALLTCLTAGIVYLARRPTVHQATARLLILNQTPNPLSQPGYGPERGAEAVEDSMPTQALIIRSPVVVGRAIKETGLSGLSTEAVGGRLIVSRPDATAKILQVSYIAADPESARKLVDGILRSYETFLEEHYHTQNNDVTKLLTRVRDDLSEELQGLERGYLELHRRSPAGLVEGGGPTPLAGRIELWNRAAGEARLRAIELREQLNLGQKLSREGADLGTIVHAMGQIGDGAKSLLGPVNGHGSGPRARIAEELEELDLRRLAAERLLARVQAFPDGAEDRDAALEAETDRLFSADPEVAELEEAIHEAKSRVAEGRRRARAGNDAAVRLATTHLAELEAKRGALKDQLRPSLLKKLANGELAEPEVQRIAAELATIRAREEALQEKISSLDEATLHQLQAAEADLVKQGPAVAPELIALRDRIARLQGEAPARGGPHDRTAIQELLDATGRSLAAVETMGVEMQKQFAADAEESSHFETDRLALDNARNNLERQRQLFNTVVDQLKHLQLTGDFRSVSAQVIDPPVVSAVRPNAMLILGLAGVVGLAIGMGIALTSEQLDPKLRSVEEIRRSVDLPMLGLIPRIPAAMIAIHGNLGLLGHVLPRSAMAERLRIVRTSLDSRRRGRPLQVILVTSPGEGDGKTVTASNLAISLAQAGRRVLLVDADMRSPKLDAIYGLSREFGLSGILSGDATVAQAAQRSLVPSMDVITAGEESSHPAELLSSPRMRGFLEEARQDYEVVIVDSPPLLLVADAGILGGLVDGVLLVVRASALRRQDAERAMEILETIGAPPLGVVINSAQCRDAHDMYGTYGTYGAAVGPVHAGGPRSIGEICAPGGRQRIGKTG